MTKEELEIEKLKVEINQLETPFWKKPTIVISFLTVVISALIGFSSYFKQVNQDNIAEIKELQGLVKEKEALDKKIELQNLNLQKTQIENEANRLKEELDELIIEVQQQKTVLKLKNEQLTHLTSEINKEKVMREEYIEKVSEITNYMADYGPAYASDIISSPSGQEKINQITKVESDVEQAKEIENFTNKVVRQTFKKYIQKKGDEIRLINN